MQILQRSLVLCGSVTIALAAGGCESATGAGGPAIFISASWTDEADSNHTIDFRSPDDGRSSGVVAGWEEGGSCEIQRCRVGGFWRDGRLEITIIREADSDQPKFTAPVYTNVDEIVLTQVGGSGGFTLVR